MRNIGSIMILGLAPLLVLAGTQTQAQESDRSKGDGSYLAHVQECVQLLMEHGTDRYGESHSPILVSILDVESRVCPQDPEELDEAWRVNRRGRRNPAGANLLSDNALLKTMALLSSLTGEERYADFAREYMDYCMKNLVDEKGFFWWGWHRHYDVWYGDYSTGPGRHGTYAGKYGRTISFLLHLYVVTGERHYLDDARALADTAIDKLCHNGLFRGHPVKPYYEAIDGVGYLLYSLLELDQVLRVPDAVVAQRAIVVGNGNQKTVMNLDNW